MEGSPNYVVNASSVADIQLAVNFARNTNFRLVVEDISHDFLGRSTGKYALSVWTRHLKSIDYVPDYSTELYIGPILEIDSGVQASELYEFANRNIIIVIGGRGETVGVMGGHILGSGHPPLSSIYGLAVDQTIALEAIHPNGTFTI